MSSTVATPLYRIVSPTVNLTLAAAVTSANKTFNTNVPTGMYMNIRRARIIVARKAAIQVSTTSDQILYELTEDTNKTAVAQQDPFALLDGGREDNTKEITAASELGFSNNLVLDSFMFDAPHPGVPTVAQQLNLVASGIRVVGSSVQQWDVFVQLYYELLAITTQIQSFLTNRIVLQRVT